MDRQLALMIGASVYSLIHVVVISSSSPLSVSAARATRIERREHGATVLGPDACTVHEATGERYGGHLTQ